MRAPLHRLKKSEILWLYKNLCRHGHDYLSHYNCYIEEAPNVVPRVGYWDIETSNLDANFGIMLGYYIKVADKNEFYSNIITRDDIDSVIAGSEDTRVVKSCIEDLGKFDKVITWYGKRFDAPFTRTRALICNIPFPYYGSIVHEDAYFIARNRLKLNSNRLENVGRSILDKTNKTRLEPAAWRGAARGDAKSLQYIAHHNKMDVIDLEKVYKKLMNFASRRDTSI